MACHVTDWYFKSNGQFHDLCKIKLRQSKWFGHCQHWRLTYHDLIFMPQPQLIAVCGRGARSDSNIKDSLTNLVAFVSIEYDNESFFFRTLRHPNVVQLIGVVLCKPIYIVTESIGKGSLLDYLRSKGTAIQKRKQINFATWVGFCTKWPEFCRWHSNTFLKANIWILIQIKLSFIPNCSDGNKSGLF